MVKVDNEFLELSHEYMHYLKDILSKNHLSHIPEAVCAYTHILLGVSLLRTKNVDYHLINQLVEELIIMAQASEELNGR